MFLVRNLGKYATFDNVRKVSVMSVTVKFEAEVGCKHTGQIKQVGVAVTL
jgi:hypothetical protein